MSDPSRPELPGELVMADLPVPGVLEMGELPTAGRYVVVPVEGPKGDKGDAGDSSEVLGYVHTQSTPATVVQIHHGLPFKPAGMYCREASSGDQVGPAYVLHPAVGVTEAGFGFPFTGEIIVS